MPRWEPDAAGRLLQAALGLFAEQGYEETTVAGIAARAGLTKRTFFRYFADKREVLFGGSRDLERIWVDAVKAAPGEASPLRAVTAAFGPVSEMFGERHGFARIRSEVIEANPELKERELIKLQNLAGAIQGALCERKVPASAALLAAQAGVTVFQVGFARWVQQDDPAAFGRILEESLAELRAVTAAD